MLSIVRLMITLVVLALGIPAQQASYTSFGAGCSPGTRPAPDLTVQGLPRIGQSFTVMYSGPNYYSQNGSSQPFLITGISNTSAGGVALPWRIPDQQNFFGCVILVSWDIVLPMPSLANFTFEDRVTIRVPNDLSLLGFSLFQQWLAFGSFSSPLPPNFLAWIVTSSGGHGVIGH